MSFSADHEFPHHNGHENDCSDRVTPDSSFLELFLIYHEAPRKTPATMT